MRKYYVGFDVHKATIAIAVLDAYGKLISQSIIETSTQAVRQCSRDSARVFQHIGAAGRDRHGLCQR